jgi:hypothetical protein
MSKKGTGYYKNRLAVEFIKAEIRAGLAMIALRLTWCFTMQDASGGPLQVHGKRTSRRGSWR